MRKRTQARELALQFLYTLDLRKGEGREYLPSFLDENNKEKEVQDYARRLIEGVRNEVNLFDEKIQSVAKNWNLSRMAAIDRNILRMAVFEMMRCDDIPPKVAINEAIDLGKKYSTQNSGGFINGILDKIRLDLENKPSSEGPQANA